MSENHITNPSRGDCWPGYTADINTEYHQRHTRAGKITLGLYNDMYTPPAGVCTAFSLHPPLSAFAQIDWWQHGLSSIVGQQNPGWRGGVQSPGVFNPLERSGRCRRLWQSRKSAHR